MDYYSANRAISLMLYKTIQDIQRLNPVEEPKEEKPIERRLDTSNFILTKEIKQSNKSVVTAHLINEFRPTRLKIGQLMETAKPTIDHLLDNTGGMQYVQI